MKITQFPNKFFRFICGHKGVLPGVGENNNLAYWDKDVKCERKGHWQCRLCSLKKQRDRVRGKGPSGLLGRMKYLLRSGCNNARKRNHISPDIVPEEMVVLWESQKGCCAACGGSLKLLSSTLDHNHKTGKVRGFIHNPCNRAEGTTKNMSNDALKNLIRFLWRCRKSS